MFTLAYVLMSVAAVAPGEPSAAEKAPEVVSLADSLKPLKARFNEAKGKLRLIAVLSPT